MPGMDQHSDRGMDQASWLDFVADTIIKMHDNGCSDNQVRFWLNAEFDRRYGNGTLARRIPIGPSEFKS